jgi:4-hydroxy-tetrahydrodipicolinate reductase
MSDKYPVIVWGTGVVGKLVIRELLDHPVFELAAVLVHDPAKDGVDVGTLVGSHPTGLAATTDIDAALGTEGTVAYFGPTAQYALENIDNMSRALRSGHNIVSTAMTPWVYPQVCPPEMLADIKQACEDGQTSCFTTGIDPGFANDLFPMTLLGVGGRVDSVLVQELLDYQYYNGDFSMPMGLGAPMDQPAVLEIPEVLILAWGHTIPMIADAVGVKLDKIDTVYEKWATPTEIAYGAEPNTGIIEAGHCGWAVSRRSSSSTSIGSPMTPHRIGRAHSRSTTTPTASRSRAVRTSPRRRCSATNAPATARSAAASPPGCGPSTRYQRSSALNRAS